MCPINDIGIFAAFVSGVVDADVGSAGGRRARGRDPLAIFTFLL
jgi:hypothetical protein